MATCVRNDKLEDISDVKKLTQLFLVDRKQSNTLLSIISLAEKTTSIPTVLACIRSFHKIFVQLIGNGEMYMEEAVTQNQELSAEEKYKVWLCERYENSIDCLLHLLQHEQTTVQELALCTLMKFVSTEGDAPLHRLKSKQLCFPNHLFQRIIRCLWSEEMDMCHLIGRFSEYLEYDDVRYYMFKSLWLDLKERSEEVHVVTDTGQTCGETFLTNVFTILDNISLVGAKDTLTNMYCPLADPEASLKVNSLKDHKKLYTSIWLEFLRNKLSTSLYKKVLVVLHEKVMPCLTSPLLLSDFLTQSYNIGGAISLLALNGLFILVHKYNLDYPDFYKKLYALFEPGVFHVKYKARFFYLADLFLTSSHLPVYLVAAFAKRLSRLSLTAPAHCLRLSIPFIYNLINRHPNCKILLHHEDGPTDMTDDPYDATEPDPVKCNAMSSSLWELKTLQSHYCPEVSMLSQRINQPIPKEEISLSDLLDLTTAEMIEKQSKKFVKDVPMNYNIPKGLFHGKEDKIGTFWMLTE